jgi:hypothetical protein
MQVRRSFLLILSSIIFRTTGTTTTAQVASTSGFSASIPDSWIKFDGGIFNPFNEMPATCSYYRDPRNHQQSFALSICKIKATPSQALSRIGFQTIDGRLVRAGSVDAQDAIIDERNGYIRVSGDASCGISDEAGFHAAGGNCYYAIIFGRDYSVALETDGSEPLSVIRKITDSVILKTPADKKLSTDILKIFKLIHNKPIMNGEIESCGSY